MTVNIYIIFPAGVITFIGMLIYLATHPEKADLLATLIYRLFRHCSLGIGRFWRFADRQVLASEVQASLNLGGTRLNRDAPGALPYALRLEYVKPKNALTHLRNGEVIVRLRQSADQDRNIANAALAYLSKGLLPRTRAHLNSELRQAIDYQTAKLMLDHLRGSGASQFFVQQILEPALSRSERLQHFTQMTSDIAAQGQFTRIYLSELAELGSRLTGLLRSYRVAQEAESFLGFVHGLRDKSNPLDFRGQYLNVSVLLVAEAGKLREEGIAPYLRRLRQFLRAGTPGIYVCGMGDVNVDGVRRIAQRAKRQKLISILGMPTYSVSSYDAKVIPAVVAVCTAASTYAARRDKQVRPLDIAIRKHIEPIRDGTWEVVGKERWPGRGSKVAVSIRASLDPYGQVAQYVSGHREEIQRAREDLGGEPVHLIAWSPTPEEFIKSALRPKRRSDILQVDLDSGDLKATVWTKTDEVTRSLIGTDGWNVNTAADLAGWDIEVSTGDQRLLCTDSELRVLVDLLERHIPELAAGKVRIEGIAREVGIGSKVVVRCDSGDAVKLCCGEGGTRSHGIAKDLGEWINFIEWNSDAERLIAQALYPLQRRRILSMHPDNRDREIEIYMADRAALQKACGTGDANLRLAEAATQWHIRLRLRDGTLYELTDT